MQPMTSIGTAGTGSDTDPPISSPGSPEPLRGRLAPLLGLAVVVLVALAVAIGSQNLALRAREYRTEGGTTGPARVSAADSGEAFQQLWRSGARGRIVVILTDEFGTDAVDNPSHVLDWASRPVSEPPVGDNNYLSALVSSGIAREVYLAVPDARWEGVSQDVRSTWTAFADGPRYRLRLYGAPVTFSRLSDLPQFREPVIVDEGLSSASGAYKYDPDGLETLLARADLVLEREQ